MKRGRHTPEQIIRMLLREADRLLAQGREVPEVAKQLEVSEATYHRWRAQYGGLKAEDAKRLKELAGENARLKRCWPPSARPDRSCRPRLPRRSPPPAAGRRRHVPAARATAPAPQSGQQSARP
jgi:putative transposase